jgi:hypothetical protein
MIWSWVKQLENSLSKNKLKKILKPPKLNLMGFNKRFFTKEHIVRNVNNIERYLNVDAAFLRDEFSIKVYKLFNEGKTKEELIKYINENK